MVSKKEKIETEKDQSQEEDKSIMAYNLIPLECDGPSASELLPSHSIYFRIRRTSRRSRLFASIHDSSI